MTADIDPDSYPHADLVRLKSGKIAIRHPHGKGPCLFDSLDSLAAEYRSLREQAAKDRAAAGRLVGLARERDEKAAKLLRAGVQAGIDLGLSYRQMSQRVGLPIATLHGAHRNDPVAAGSRKDPEEELT